MGHSAEGRAPVAARGPKSGEAMRYPASASSSVSVFRAAARFGEAERLEVVLRPANYARRSLGNRVRDALFALATSRSVIEGADVFKTAGTTDEGERRELDLLKDELRVERPVRRRGDGSRALDAESAYAAIETAYEELRDELRDAHGIWMEADRWRDG